MTCKSGRHGLRATAVFVALTMPFATLAHLAAEAASLGASAPALLWSAEHAYLAALNAAALGILLAVLGAGTTAPERRRRIAVLIAGLPGRGRGPRMFATAALWQLAFLAATQLAEGDPIAAGHIFFGALAAIIASFLGASIVARCELRVLEAIVALYDALDPQHRLEAPAAELPSRHTALTERLFYSLSIANRPPPLSAT